MFSARLPPDLTPNPLAEAVSRRRAAGRPFVDLTLSNPTRAAFTYPDDLLAPLGDGRALEYAPHPLGLETARNAVAGDYARRGVDVTPSRLFLAPSTSDAYSVLFKLLADPGDEVLLPRPSYPLFDHLTRLDALRARSYELEYHGTWGIDFESVERAVTSRTRAVLVVSPNNPTGSFLTTSELERLAFVCGRAGAAIICDEVFADYTLNDDDRDAARVLERRDVLGFSLGGLSKSVGLPQVKLGWAAASGPDALVSAAMERLEIICDTYLSVATPVQAAADELLRNGAGVRRQIGGRVRRNYDALRRRVERTPSCSVLPGDGGWYGVVQVPSIQPEEELVLSLLEGRDVLVHPGFFFDFPREAFLVVSLLLPPEDFDRGADQLFRHFDCTAASADD
jgi:aspartate/methionine/tyrosine aminotransferase